MGVKATGGEKNTSLFRRFWSWLTRNCKKTPRPEAIQKPAVPQPPEAFSGEAYTGRLYKLLEENEEPLRMGDFSQEPEVFRVYTYCGVVFPKADIVYHYICMEEDVQVGDRVLVPVKVHGEHKQAVGIVISIGQYLDRCVPRPLQQTKCVIKRL